MEDLKALVVEECYRRAQLYDSFRIKPNDTKETREAKVELLILQLHEWKADPIAWLNDMAWAPDPKGAFGSKAVPEELANYIPTKMVPFIPYPKQREVAIEFDALCRGDVDGDIGLLKSRQVAMTTMMIWMAEREFLFFKQSPGLMGTYEEGLIDQGGKGQRDPDSLFGRLRMFLDCMCHCIPALRFNSHIYKNRHSKADRAAQKWKNSGCGFESHEDTSFKLTRPPWYVYGNEIFPEAKGNWILGMLPSDSFGRSLSAHWALLDEIGQYNLNRDGNDKDAWNACANNVKVRVGWGTIGKKSPLSSMLYELTEGRDEDDYTLTSFWVHWSDIVPYMAGARWKCRACAHSNPHPVLPGPGPKGHMLVCDGCVREIIVRYKDLWSPWYERVCLKMKMDKVGIARELDMDWQSSQGDTLFAAIDAGTVLERTTVRPTMIAFDGFDPGNSVDNPAAWVCGLYDPRARKIHIVGYWMAANAFAEFFVPFFKRWSSAQTKRMRLVYGKYSGMTFSEAFEYSDDAYRMMDHLATIGVPIGDIYGDKYGSHQNMTESAYDILANYGIYVNYEYTKDREALVRRGQEWAARIAIDDRIEDIKPMSPLNKRYPSIFQVFTTAKPTPVTGQGTYRVDVDKKTPPHVNHACDAWFYLCRAFAGHEIHASADSGGRFAVDGRREVKSVYFGDGSLGF